MEMNYNFAYLFFFKQKTAYDMRISDWSSDVCSSDLINVDEELEVDMLEIPAMIIQPFVENAILHGLMPLDGPRKLTIDIVDGGEYVSCSITDNGVGREEAARSSEGRRVGNGGVSPVSTWWWPYR